MTTAAERAAMRHAIAISALGLGSASPNPPVGCVILDSAGHAIGEGHHVAKGGPHAETQALSAAGVAAEGGTAVVTLEPCNHHGRTPPCHQGLLDAGIARVLVAAMDPTSRGNGGVAELRTAGIDVVTGVLEDEALIVLGPWLTTLQAGRPFVTWVATARPRGSVHDAAEAELRAGYDAVLGTELSEGRPDAHGSGVFALPSLAADADPHACLSALAASGARTVLVTAARAGRHFLSEGLVDQVILFIADRAGSLAYPDGRLGPRLDEFRLTDVARMHDGVRVTLRR